jgi:hypothetical protein
MTTTSNNDGEDGNDHRRPSFRLNPEALVGVPKLPGLEQIEVVYVQHAPTWARWTEGLMIHVIGSGMVAIIAFVLGLMAGNAGG